LASRRDGRLDLDRLADTLADDVLDRARAVEDRPIIVRDQDVDLGGAGMANS